MVITTNASIVMETFIVMCNRNIRTSVLIFFLEWPTLQQIQKSITRVENVNKIFTLLLSVLLF